MRIRGEEAGASDLAQRAEVEGVLGVECAGAEAGLLVATIATTAMEQLQMLRGKEVLSRVGDPVVGNPSLPMGRRKP